MFLKETASGILLQIPRQSHHFLAVSQPAVNIQNMKNPLLSETTLFLLPSFIFIFLKFFISFLAIKIQKLNATTWKACVRDLQKKINPSKPNKRQVWDENSTNTWHACPSAHVPHIYGKNTFFFMYQRMCILIGVNNSWIFSRIFVLYLLILRH